MPLAILITALVTSTAVAIAGYIYLLRPAQRSAREHATCAHWLALQLSDERTVRSDLLKWIEHETRAYKAPAVEAALKQRVKERLELLEQLQQQRQKLAA